MNWKTIYDAYPVNRHLIWLNNCGTVPAGRHIVEAMNRFLDGYSQKGILTDAASYTDIRKAIKAILSKLLHCQPEELCLIHNTAEGMNFISHGLEFKPNDEIILLENEYPSNVYPWLHLKDKGVVVKTALMKNTPEDFVEALTELITDRTRLISISVVHWCTGMPLPLETIGNLCRKRGIFFVVDGAQGVGVQPIDVKKACIDFMAFPACKWLMGPIGTAVFYISMPNLAKLRPIFIGTESVIQDEQYLPYKTDLKPSADRYMMSSGNFNDWVYFLAALELLDRIGFDVVRTRLFELAEYFNRRLRQIGLWVFSDHFPNHRTAITVCEKPEVSSATIVERLKESGVICVERLGRIRFSPHIYISEHQLDDVIRAVERICISQMYVRALRQ